MRKNGAADTVFWPSQHHTRLVPRFFVDSTVLVRYTDAMSDALKARIIERRRDLAALDERRTVLIVELRAYEDALRLIEGESEDDRTPTESEPRESLVRSRSPKWTELLKELAARHPNAFTLDDAEIAAKRIDFHPTRGNIRSQMAMFVNRGILTRLGLGAFRFTDAGARTFAQYDTNDSVESVIDQRQEDMAKEKSASLDGDADSQSSDQSAPPSESDTLVGPYADKGD